jgi:hypothetical protein
MRKQRKRTAREATRPVNLVVRVSSELRYLAEIAARAQHRTVSSFAEWAIDKALADVELTDGFTDENDEWVDAESVETLREKLWDVDEPDRLAKLAINFPRLLTHDEQALWKLVKGDPFYWNEVRRNQKKERWEWDTDEDNLNFEELGMHWESLKKVAKKELPKDALPKWEEPAYTDNSNAEGPSNDSVQGGN